MTLFNQITDFKNLYNAAHSASKGHRSDVSVANYFIKLESNLINLQKKLVDQTYRPGKYSMFSIYDPKPRIISAPPFRDRVVHHAICGILDKSFDKRMISDSYACRKGKGTHAAIKRAQRFSKLYPWYLKSDIKSFFETIDHQILKSILRKFIYDPNVESLLTIIIDSKPYIGPSDKGLPLGNLTSQHFANLYLNQLDHFLKDHMGVKAYIRYMDDFIVFSNNKNELKEVLEKIDCYVHKYLSLQLKPSATLINKTSVGIPFLGFRVFPGLIRIKRKNLIRLRRRIKKRSKEVLYCQNESQVTRASQSISSMLAHIQHANTLNLRRKEFVGNAYI